MQQLIKTSVLAVFLMSIFQACTDPESGIGPLYLIEVSPAAVNVEIDSTQQFTAIGRDVDLNVIEDLTFTWTSRDALVGMIDENGVLTGLSTGITMITAKSGTVESAQAEVNVYDPVFSIALSPETLTVDYAATGSFSAVGKDVNGDDIVGLSYQWQSDNTDIASVDENGLVTGIGVGTTTIKASHREVESLPAPVTIEMTFPAVTTAEVTDITEYTANVGGTIIHNGGGALTAAGVCWSTTDPPTIDDNYLTTDVVTGAFNLELSGLNSETSYYVRVYATNAAGTGYGATTSFTTDEHVYQEIQIGNQVWMAENLQVTHYRNGDEIPNITNATEWPNLTTGAYNDYDNNSENVVTYGRLYNWYAVNDSRNIAPEGWHVPTDDEWKELEMALGMSQSEADVTGWRGTNEGSKLAGNAELWNDGALENNAEFETSGFTALPGGYRHYNDRLFADMGSTAYFWSATEGDSYYAGARVLHYSSSNVLRVNYYKTYGYSVRLVRD